MIYRWDKKKVGTNMAAAWEMHWDARCCISAGAQGSNPELPTSWLISISIYICERSDTVPNFWLICLSLFLFRFNLFHTIRYDSISISILLSFPFSFSSNKYIPFYLLKTFVSSWWSFIWSRCSREQSRQLFVIPDRARGSRIRQQSERRRRARLFRRPVEGVRLCCNFHSDNMFIILSFSHDIGYRLFKMMSPSFRFFLWDVASPISLRRLFLFHRRMNLNHHFLFFFVLDAILRRDYCYQLSNHQSLQPLIFGGRNVFLRCFIIFRSRIYVNRFAYFYWI